jgi:formyl-CoA transferase
MLLGDLGARVIKIEQPRKGDDTRAWGPPFVAGESAYFLSINRNKESLTLDFKHPKGRAILEQLIAKADVLVENFRPGTLGRMKLDYASLAKKYPRLIYCSLSGFGHTGPRTSEAGYDAVLQGEGGMMSLTGAPDVPPVRVGVAIADIVSGMFAAQGISAALYARERTGKGQQVDIAMLDAVAALLTYQAGIFFATDVPPVRLGNRHPTIVPYETFTASDGEFVLAVGTDDQWAKFCEIAAIDPGETFATNRGRVTGYAELRPTIAGAIRKQPRSYWIERLRGAGVPCGSVRNLQEVFADPQIAARDMVVPMTHPLAGEIRVLGSPLKLSETASSQRTPPPVLGQHTESVLTNDLGLSADALTELRADGVV